MSLKSTLRSKAFQQLLNSQKLSLVSTDRQLANGTIALSGKIKRKPVSYKLTATGAVLSNEFVARRVAGYQEGLKAVAELIAKRTR